LVKRMGLEPAYRSAYVESRLLGERLKFLFANRPSPESAILVTGSGRSGTTWIADVLCHSIRGLQLIFEPLHPAFNAQVRALVGSNVDEKRLRSLYLRAGEDNPEWESLWRQILTGRMRNYLTELERTAFFPRRYLVKAIRANLMLGFVYDHLRPRVLYAMRHPCAVVQSRMQVGWQVRVEDILCQQALVDDYLHPWVDDITRECDPVGIHAVWWAVENMVALRELTERPHHIVTYEALSLSPRQEFQEILHSLGFPLAIACADSIQQLSRVTDAAGFQMEVPQRLAAWQSYFTLEQQRRILDWAWKLGITVYDDTVWPSTMEA
jgi:hypothetical protein